MDKAPLDAIVIGAAPYGTTCARVGGMPSTLLVEAANAYHRRHTFDAFGITSSHALAADIPAVLRRVRPLRDEFFVGTVDITNALGSQSISGRAHLLSSTQVHVNDQTYHAKSIVLATGSHPVRPTRPCKRWTIACSPPIPCLNKPRWAHAWPPSAWGR